MTEKEKNLAGALRQKGVSYSAIADSLGVSRDAVKSYLRRAKEVEEEHFCAQCGKSIETLKHQNRRFCSDTCRTRWWNENQSRKLPFIGKCAYCHKEFGMRRRNEKKYCSHACYIAARFKLGDAND